MAKRSRGYLFKYELLNNIYNGYSFFFGVMLPVMLYHLISFSVLQDVPASAQLEVQTSLFLGFAILLPLAAVFLSYAASYSNELEKHIPVRMSLYGFSQGQLFRAKLLAIFVFMSGGLVLYALCTLPFRQIEPPTLPVFLVWLLALYLFAALLLFLAHGIALLIGKFGVTYGICMGIYFLLMLLGGMMGVRPEQLPDILQRLGGLFPSTHLGDSFVDFWLGKAYNFGPLISAYLFFGAMSFIILLLSFRLKGRAAR